MRETIDREVATRLALANGWRRTERVMPPEGVEVATMDSGFNESSLVHEGNLWWFPDRSMYVYYTPTFWRPVS